MKPTLALLFAATRAGSAANAQTIFRYGHPFTNVPCADASTLVVASAVSAEQRAEAREVARREEALAATMVRDRRVQEAALSRRSPAR